MLSTILLVLCPEKMNKQEHTSLHFILMIRINLVSDPIIECEPRSIEENPVGTGKCEAAH